MDGKDLFLLWWLFLDVDHTRNLRVLISHPSYRKFNHELVGFLANNLVQSVSKCTFRYNWILKADYLTALSTNMPNLRHVIFYHDPPTNDLLKLLAENCKKLWKLEFIGKVDSDIQGSNDVNNHTKIAFGKGKLTSKGYEMFFEKQVTLHEIDLVQIEKQLSKDHFSVTPALRLLTHMKLLKKLVVSHNYVEIIENLPQIENLELRLTAGIHPLETIHSLQNIPYTHNSLVSKEADSMDGLFSVPLDDLLFSDMFKLDKLNLPQKFPGIRKLTLELTIFAAAKNYEHNETEEPNPSLQNLGVLNSDYASSSVNTILNDLPVSLNVRFALDPRILQWEGGVFGGNFGGNFAPRIPLFESFDTFLMKTFEAFRKAETIVLIGGVTEMLFQFRIAWISVRNTTINDDEHQYIDQEDDWGGWSFGLKKYMKSNGASIDGYLFTKVTFPNLTVLELNFGEARSHARMAHSHASRNPPISHDLFCQVFFLSENLRKIKLTIPGGIALFNEKEFISRCKSVYGRKRLSKLSQISLWFSKNSVKRHIPELLDRVEPEVNILSVMGFLHLLSICSKEKSIGEMLWLNVTGDDEKRYLREHETEGSYLPCVTHLLNRFVPMVATYKNHEGSIGPRWICSDLRRATLLTS